MCSIAMLFLLLTDWEMMKSEAYMILPIIPFLVIIGIFLITRVKKLKEFYIELKEEADIEFEQARVEREAYLKAHPYLEAEEFFKKARADGITDAETKAGAARLLLYARNNNISGTDEEIIKRFKIGKEYVIKFETLERLEALRKREYELFEHHTRYAAFSYGQKSIQYCQDKINQAQKIIYQCECDEESVRSGGEATYMLGKQKESSWALHGGIANGIAGGAAGIAVAVDTERRNIEKRQNNANLVSSIAAVSAMQLEKIYKRKNSAQNDVKYWKEKLEEAKLLLVGDYDNQQLIEMLKPEVKSYEVSETGAVTLKVEVHSTSELYIYDDVRAVVDGCIKVILKVDNEVVGSAVCVLPFGGMSCSTTVYGICLEPERRAQEYTFDFQPENLWVTETKV